MNIGDRQGLAISGRMKAGLAVCWLALAWWASIGHHGYFLSGDPGVNFIQSVRIGRDYFRDNLAAHRGEPGREHVALITEGGFPCLLAAARAVNERLPFMVNALLLPLLLWMLAVYVGRLDPGQPTGYLAALLAPLLLASLPVTASQLWSLTSPFRDLLSHLLGLGALLVVSTDLSRRRIWRRVLLAGILCGLSSWARLSGALFAIPAAVQLGLLPIGQRRWQRWGLLACLGGGVALGLLPLAAQNVLEGRPWMLLPQSGSLLLSPETAGGASRQGWHPVNLPLTLPGVVSLAWNTWPGWMSAALLAGLGWWIHARQGAWRRFLPIPAGAAGFALFYGCYDRVVHRYLFPALLFIVAASAVAAAWWITLGLRRIPSARGRRSACIGLLAGLTLWAFGAGLRAPPDWTEMRRQWADARQFRTWIRDTLPQPASVITSVPGYAYWQQYFRPHQLPPWTNSPLHRGQLQMPRAPLPADRHLFLLTAPSPESGEQPLWSRETILNRYDLQPFGELPLHSRAAPGLRAYQLSLRPLHREIDLPDAGASNDFLFLFLRDLSSTNSRETVTLDSDAWASPLDISVQAGVNLVALPATHGARPARLTLRGTTPVPSVVEARWMAEDEPVGLALSDYTAAAWHALLMDNAGMDWWGYNHWRRDWGGLSDRHRSVPHAVWTNGTALRLPLAGPASPPHRAVRLYFSGVGDAGADPGVLYSSQYRWHDMRLDPVTILLGEGTWKGSRVVSFIHEVGLAGELNDAAPGPGQLQLEVPGETLLASPPFWILHRVEYAAGHTPPSSGRQPRPSTQRPGGLALPPGTEHLQPASPFHAIPLEWAGEHLARFVANADAEIGQDGRLLADDWSAQAWRAYGGGPTEPALSLVDAFLQPSPSHQGPVTPFGARPPVFLAVLEPPDPALADVLPILRLHGDLETCRVLELSTLIKPLGAWRSPDMPRLVLRRMQGWSRLDTTQEVCLDANTPVALQVDAGWLRPPGTVREPAQLYLDDQLLDRDVPNGVSCYTLPPRETAATARLSLRSTQPVPADLQPRIRPDTHPVVFQFDNRQHPSSALLFEAGDWATGPNPGRWWFRNTATLRVPVSRPDRPEDQLLVFTITRDDTETAETRFSVEDNETRQPLPSWTAQLTGSSVLLATLLPKALTPTWRRVTLRRTAPDPAVGLAAVAELAVFGFAESEPFVIAMGPHDRAFVGPGFYRREPMPADRFFRWTRAEAELRLFRPSATNDCRLRLVFSDLRDPRAAPADLRLHLNGQELTGAPETLARADGFRTWTGLAPAACWRDGLNRLQLTCRPWSPADHGLSDDHRELGVMVSALSIDPP